MYHFHMDGEYFLGADHGRLVDLGGLGVRFKIYSEQTGGNFAVVEHPIISLGGFERLFEEVAALLEEQKPGPSADQDVIVLSNQYGLALDRTWLPELHARFGPMRMV